MKHLAILDFGSQYTHLIARRIRDFGTLAKIYPAGIKARALPNEVIGIILSGGPQSVYDQHSVKAEAGILKLGKPVLGLCYGHQLMAHLLGGEVLPGKVREYGRASLKVIKLNPLFSKLPRQSQVWMSHGDTVTKLPSGFVATAQTFDCPIAAMADVKRRLFGLQFHPEVHHTSAGGLLLKNFVFNVCRAKADWQIKNILAGLLKNIKRQARGKKVFLLVSGGVDSTVCFALLTKALGEKNVYGLHIDTGFLRRDESSQIMKDLKQAGFSNLHLTDSSAYFYARLQGVVDPETKRKIIGQAFLDVKDKMAKALKLNNQDWLLGQGTIYPDTIESGATRHADTIKTHHNRVAAIQKMIAQGRVIEPIVDFYKDEVRAIGRLLGLPAALLNRHPFPGPGLAIRILCAPKSPPLRGGARGGAGGIQTTPYPLLEKEGTIYYHLLPLKSVGVQGDNRTYAHPLVIWNYPPSIQWEKLDKLSSQITNSTHAVNRVLLRLNPRPGHNKLSLIPAANELTNQRVALLQTIDALVTEELRRAKIYYKFWQCPVVLIPIGSQGRESIVLRPVVSREAMTANFGRWPKKSLNRLVKTVLSTGRISYIFYDITNKPPGTIEWE